MLIHGNISQALNSMEDASMASLSIEHINKALQLIYKQQGVDFSFKQKFMYRKAKALSMNPDKDSLDEAKECIEDTNTWKEQKNMSDLHAQIETKEKQLTGTYNVFDLFTEFQLKKESYMLEYIDDNIEIRKSKLYKG